MTFELQPQLKNDLIELRPLIAGDFEPLFAVASDPLIWEQHPTPDRHRRDRFEVYFAGAMQSKGALLALEAKSGQVIGCSRFYDHDPSARSVFIGYSFLARRCWGTTYNRAMKTLMLDHAFGASDSPDAVAEVRFHVGAKNLRSQKAMERLGGEKLGTVETQYFGEQTHLNVVYRIRAAAWKAKSSSGPAAGAGSSGA